MADGQQGTQNTTATIIVIIVVIGLSTCGSCLTLVRTKTKITQNKKITTKNKITQNNYKTIKVSTQTEHRKYKYSTYYKNTHNN